MRIKCFIIFLCTFYSAFCTAQDLHFSQFNASPLNINPALTGLFNSDFRLVGNYRNQWSSITTPFVTYSASADMNIRPLRDSKDFIGAGLLFNADRAGDANFTTIQVSPCISYTKAFANQKFFISYGMQAGIIQQHFNSNELFFDKQYNGDVFDANLNSGENLESTSAIAFDAASGFNAFLKPSDRYNFNAGIAIYHFNKPTFSFASGSSSQILPRITIHSSGTLALKHGMELLPGFIIQKQGVNTEYTVGSYIRLTSNPRIIHHDRVVTVYGGLWIRLKDHDAAILTTRLDYEKLSIGLSYDVNISRLAVASKALGGVEISIIYLFKKPKTSSDKPIPCPIFF